MADLSIAFDWQTFHVIFYWQSYDYGFTFLALKLIHSYLRNRKYRMKIIFVEQKGFILRPLMFNIFLVGPSLWYGIRNFEH